MKSIYAAAAVLLAGSVALGTATPALAQEEPADPNAPGTYTFEAANGEKAQWTITACGDDAVHCVHVVSSGSDKRAPWNANAYWTVGSWLVVVQQPDAILCPNGDTRPGSNNYSWDDTALTGYASVNVNGECGGNAQSVAIPFTLTRTGQPPRMPDQPVQVEPYIVDIPPPYVPPAGGAPAGPMPAESDPALVATPNVIPNVSDPLTEAIVAEPGFNAQNPGGDHR